MTKSGEICSFGAATEEEMYEVDKVLKEIEAAFDLKEMIQKSKVELTDYKDLHTAINDHCILGNYLFSFKRLSNDNCSIPHICRENEIFTTLHHLPFPMPKESDEKFRHFNELYDNASNENYRPSRIEKEESSHQMAFPPSRVKTLRILVNRFNEEISHSCGTILQDIVLYDDTYNGIITNVFVKANLNCSLPMEIPFYSACNEPVCYHCGCEENQDGKTLVKDDAKYPMCNACVSKKLLPIDKRTRMVKPKK